MSTLDCIVDRDNFGFGWGTWLPQREHGWDAITSAASGSTHDCSNMDNFFARADEVNSVCCPDGAECTDGMPDACGLTCAQIFVPFYDDCTPMLLDLMDNHIEPYTALSEQCLTNSRDDIWHALQDLRDDGCEWGDLVVEAVGSSQAVNPGASAASGPAANGGHRLLLSGNCIHAVCTLARRQA